MIMKNILEHWDINYHQVTEVQKDVWRLDDDYYLKADNSGECLKNIPIFQELRDMGIPAPEVIRTTEGNAYLELNQAYYVMTHKLDGRHLSKEEVMDHPDTARYVGQSIAKLHGAFKGIEAKHEFKEKDFLEELNGWITDSLEKYAPDSFTNGVLKKCKSDLEIVYPKLDRQLIHRDLHLGNLLFSDGVITGYIDFDLSQINVKIFDIAYFTVGWIVDSFTDNEFMDKWEHSIRMILLGYQDVQELSEIEINSLSIMMCFIEVLFVAYFAGIKDKENARKAEECLKWLWGRYESNWI